MALQVWLPLNGDLHNQGLSNLTITNNGATIDNNGKIGKCYSFNGTDNYLVFNNLTCSNWATFSLTCWCYPSSDFNYLFLIRGGGAHRVRISGDGFMFRDSNNSTQRIVEFGTIIPLDTWSHIACIYNRGEIFMYVNGVLTNHSTTYYHNNSTFLSDHNEVRLARQQSSSGNSYYNGKINDFHIYDHALSDKEVEEISKGLVLHYKLDGDGKGNDNILVNTHFDNKYSQTTGWNTSKNGTLMANSWGGYNSGVTNQATVYHAHLKEFNEEYVYEYIKTSAESWLGISQGGLQTKLIAGQTYTFSWEEYHIDGTNRVGTGLYYYKSGATSANFHLGIQSDTSVTRVIGQWQKYSYTFVAPSDADYSKSMVWYIYGHYNGNGTFYMRHPKLELGDSATTWMPHPSDNLYSLYNISTIYDSSGYSYNGITIGEPILDTNTVRYNESLKFTTNTDSVTITPYLTNGQTLGEITVSCWFKTNTLNSTAPNIFSLGENSFLRCRLANTTSIWSYYRLVSTQVSDTYSCKTLTDNNWHMLSFVFDNGIEYVYIDGIQIGTTNRISNGTYLTCSSLNWHLAGYTANSENFIGNLSDFRIYATALTEDQIKELYETSKIIDGTNVKARDLEAST